MQYRRIDKPTPHGGDYSEKWYLDENGEPVDQAQAVAYVIYERRKDGTVVCEYRGAMPSRAGKD